MRIADLVTATEVEGPGLRAALWVQGCSLRCPGCCNPGYLDPSGGQEVDPIALADRLAGLPVEGVTILGGEPLDQAEEVSLFVARLRACSGLGIILFTGYSWEEVQATPARRWAVADADLVKAGPYLAAEAPDVRRWIGSRNQTVHALTFRYAALAAAWEPARREVELHFDGERLVVNGTPWEGLAGAEALEAFLKGGSR